MHVRHKHISNLLDQGNCEVKTRFQSPNGNRSNLYKPTMGVYT